MRKYLLFSLLLAACSTSRQSVHTSDVSQLNLLHKHVVPYNTPFNGTTIGGLSGIDYDSARNVYYLICDDRSEHEAARYYTAQVPVNGDKVIFTTVNTLPMRDGHSFPATKDLAPDPEAMRYNPHTAHLIWSSEGERIVNAKDTILKDPAIYEISPDGHFIDTFPIPVQMHMQATNNGPRKNGTFEGLGFTPDGKYMFVSVEEPRYEDGPRAGLKDTTAWIRIIKYNLQTRQPIAQFAYKLAPIAAAPVPADAFSINGIPDILVVSENQLLIMERSFSTGVKNCTIRLYKADLSHATDVSSIQSLQTDTHFTPVVKKPLFNFESLHTYVDNVEGMTFGPRLPNGHRSLICVADNNFSDKEETQFYIFEIK
ncbi:esterase-like activity of phytase family protein [Chitinophaga sp.]|uniref:esterase-like activity of phytase family protein n=1 Tax=Chitinophaga sp. TaxID=1869181 RepID=UPI0031D5789E